VQVEPDAASPLEHVQVFGAVVVVAGATVEVDVLPMTLQVALLQYGWDSVVIEFVIRDGFSSQAVWLQSSVQPVLVYRTLRLYVSVQAYATQGASLAHACCAAAQPTCSNRLAVNSLLLASAQKP